MVIQCVVSLGPSSGHFVHKDHKGMSDSHFRRAKSFGGEGGCFHLQTGNHRECDDWSSCSVHGLHGPSGCHPTTTVQTQGAGAEGSTPFHSSDSGLLVCKALSKPHQRLTLGCKACAEWPQETYFRSQGLRRQLSSPWGTRYFPEENTSFSSSCAFTVNSWFVMHLRGRTEQQKEHDRDRDADIWFGRSTIETHSNMLFNSKFQKKRLVLDPSSQADRDETPGILKNVSLLLTVISFPYISLEPRKRERSCTHEVPSTCMGQSCTQYHPFECVSPCILENAERKNCGGPWTHRIFSLVEETDSYSVSSNS